MQVRGIGGGASVPPPSVSVSDPPYPTRHSGPVLVCGFGASLHDDYESARRLRPDAPVIAVNRAAKAVKAFALFTLHPDEIACFAGEQNRAFGPGFETHAGGPRKHCAGINYWWRDAVGLGTSAWAAARMGRLMGFDEVILCGVPLDDRPYADNRMARAFRRPRIVETYRAFIAQDTAWHSGIRAMSGYLRGVLGGPD